MSKKIERKSNDAGTPPVYPGYELSAVSEYYIYGRGNAEDYARAVNNIKEELRKAAYGEQLPPVAVCEKKKKTKTNRSAVAILILSLLIIATFAISYVLPEGTAGDFVCIGALDIDAVVAEAVLLWVAQACAALTAIISLFRLRRRNGGLLKTMAALTFLLLAALSVTLFVKGGMPGIGLWIMNVLSLACLLAAIIDKKSEAEG